MSAGPTRTLAGCLWRLEAAALCVWPGGREGRVGDRTHTPDHAAQLLLTLRSERPWPQVTPPPPLLTLTLTLLTLRSDRPWPQVTASYDRKRARALKASEAAAYEAGLAAHPSECEEVPMSRANSLPGAAAAADTEMGTVAQVVAPVPQVASSVRGRSATNGSGMTHAAGGAYQPDRYSAYV